MNRIVWIAGLLIIAYQASAYQASAQQASGQQASGHQIAAVGSGQIAGVSQNVRAGFGSIARGPGGEKAGSGYSLSESKARVVAGRVAGYGAHTTTGLGEYASRTGSGSGFDSNRDFPNTDFVATMPGPVLGSLSAPAPAPASHFGMTLSAGAVHSGSPSSHPPSSSPHRLRNANAILNPFTHTLGGGLSTNPGMPTVPGSGIH